MDLNIRQVEAFKATMEAGSVTAAARRLNVSQPSVTKHLRRLEEHLGVLLFDRVGNRLQPTLAAQSFFDQIKRTYLGLDHLSRYADDLKNDRHGEIIMAAMPLIAHSWLPDITATFLSDNPNVSMSMPVRSSRWIIEWVAAGRVEFGIGLSSGSDNGVSKDLLMSVPLVCVYPATHAFHGLSVVDSMHLDQQTLISLSNFDHWRLAVETALDDRSIQPSRRIETFTTYSACELVSRGVGIAIVDVLTALKYEGPALKWALFQPTSTFEMFLMRPRHWLAPTLTQKLIDLIRDHAEATNEKLRSLCPSG
ncbi:MAG: LysR substrate-binding domain-containing protein [Rhodospirillaceae bacterium]|nr:LysR substrate-binding domain-containing protein [Rhodospirillaceae bacterium]